MASKSAKVSRAETPPGLSRTAIIETARDLARKQGFAKVSTRALGARLGVSAPALYYYFKNKRDLFEAVAVSIFEELATLDESVPWTEQLRAYVLAYQQRLVEYPGLARVVLANRDSRPGLLWTETILSILQRGGFHDGNIWPAMGMLVFFVNPMTLFDEKPRAAEQSLFDVKRARRAIDQSPCAYPMLGALLQKTKSETIGALPLTYDSLLHVTLDRIIEQLQRETQR